MLMAVSRPGNSRVRRSRRGGTLRHRNRQQLAPVGWIKTFSDPTDMRVAIVDRLTFAGQIIETGISSERLAHARKKRAAG